MRFPAVNGILFLYTLRSLPPARAWICDCLQRMRLERDLELFDLVCVFVVKLIVFDIIWTWSVMFEL